LILCWIEAVDQILKDIQTMLLHSGDIAANSTEDLRAKSAAKAPRDFLFDLRHAQIAFRGIVVKGNLEIIHERQCLVRPFVQSLKEVSSSSFLGPSTLPGFPWLIGKRIVSFAAGKNRFIPRAESAQCLRRQLIPSRRLGAIDHFLDMTQQLYERRRPTLLSTFLTHSDQLAQMMGIAQCVQAIKIVVRRPSVMHQPADELLKRRVITQGFLAPAQVDEVVRVQLGTQRVLPQPFAVHVNARFISMYNRTCSNKGLYRLFCFGKTTIRGFQNVIERSFAQTNAKNIAHRFSSSLLRQKLIAGQIGRHAANSWPVLHRRINACRELCRMYLSALGALAHFCTVLRHFQLDLRRQIVDLSLLNARALGLGQIAPAWAVSRKPMGNNYVGSIDLLQTHPFMSRLSAAVLAGFGSQALRVRGSMHIG